MFEDIIASVRTDSQPTRQIEDATVEVSSVSSTSKQEPEISSDIRISVIGIGGAGCNCVNRLCKQGIKSARTLCINTDGKHLNTIQSSEKLLIGRSVTRGLGAGGDPDIAKKCAEADRKKIADIIGENELVFLAAGMGGGTGGGATAPIAQIAKEQGAMVIAMVTYPFALERIRLKKAQKSLQELIKICDTVVVIDNNRLASYVPNLALDKAFALADSITGRAVTGITDTIMFPSLMNIDYADVKAVMKTGGISMISLGQASGPERVDRVVQDTLSHPLLDVNYEGANGALIHIEGGSDLTLGDSIRIGEKISASFDPGANVKIGARIDPTLQEKLRVTAIVTGVHSPYILSEKQEEESLEAMEYL